MVFSILRIATLAALLCTLVTPLKHSSTSPVYLTPRVPWKESGLWEYKKADGDHRKEDVDHKKDDGHPTGGACTVDTSSRGSWLGDYNIDTDMDEHWPETGKIVKYHLDITNETMSPDGFARQVIVINGQFPGPTLVADWGDTLEITVTNHLTLNGTGVHWHGMRQLGSNEMDGVNGITECPIAPGETKLYRFQATQYGTTWYHSHHSVQYSNGLWGTMIINGPATAHYDVDLGTFPITDWFHAPIFTVNSAALHATGPPTADNILVNGSMTSSSGGKYAVTTLTPGKTHLLRIINVGTNNWIHAALDGHKFTVVSADFIPIVPYETESISIAVGQRYDVLIHATQETSNYWLRVGTGGYCDGPNANGANIRSIFRYAGAESSDPNSTATAPLTRGCYDEAIVPHVKTNVPQDVPEEMKVGFTHTAGSGNLVQWTINGTPMTVNLKQPTLQSVADGVSNFSTSQHVFQVGEKNKWQYWVIQQEHTTPPPLPHPIHLHGHDFFVLAQVADSRWTGDISKLQTINPPRRDTATLPALGYLVLAFESDNPGIWLMHCHVPFHVSAGLGVQFVERQDEILKSNGGLDGMQKGCKSWTTFEDQFGVNNGSVLVEGDTGL